MISWHEVETVLSELERLAERIISATINDVDSHLGRMLDYIDSTPLLKEFISSCPAELSEDQVADNINAFLKTWGKTPLEQGKNSAAEIAFLYCAFGLLRNEKQAIAQIGKIYAGGSHVFGVIAVFGDKLVTPFYNDIEKHFQLHRSDYLQEVRPDIAGMHPTKKTYDHDVFISHASADKSEFVNALYEGLQQLGIDIWYDSNTAVYDWGDSPTQQITQGLEKCRFAIVVLSKEFFGRKWPEWELNELLTRQNESGEKVVLPLLYQVAVAEMIERYPILEEVKARSVKDGESPRDIVIDFARILIKALKSEVQA